MDPVLHYHVQRFTGFVAMNLTTVITIPTLSDLVPAMSVFGWIIIQQRLGYTFDWNLPWGNYRAGFGSTDADYWLGLERMHLLTSSQPYRLRVEVQERSANLWYSAEYWSFKIGDELNDKYRLEVSGYSGDAGDSFQFEGSKYSYSGDGNYYQNGMKFTTYDQDNDLHPTANCAASNEGGFWFKRCHMGCLTCKKDRFDWYTLSTSGHIANSRMLIKPQ